VSSGYPSPKLEIETRWIEQSLYRSWVYSLLNSKDLEGMIADHGHISNGGLSTLTFREPWLHKKLYFYFSNSADRIGSKLREHWYWRKETKSKRNNRTRFLWRKGRLVKDFRNFLVRKTFLCGNFRTILLTLYLTCEFGCYWLITLRCNDFTNMCDAHAYEDMMHMFMRYGAHDAC
jgi:hypothetical protein